MRFESAKVLVGGAFEKLALSVRDGRISLDAVGEGQGVDLSGYLILPGIIDLHGDAFDRHLAARRGALQDITRGYWALDGEFGANGITTAYLAQFYSWEGGMRGPQFAERMMEGLVTAPHLVTDMRLQLRLETSMVDEFDAAFDLIERFQISYVVFNDHLPREALRKGKKPPRLNGTALKSGRSPESHLKLMYAYLENEPREAKALLALSEKLRMRDVRLGSHDDKTPEARAAYAELGATIAEFPETTQTAQTAYESSQPVIMGAPNIMRGASHNGNASARHFVALGIVNSLVSDYHYPSLLGAIRVMDHEALSPLEKSWEMISQNPAKLMGHHDRGRIEEGLRADLVMIDEETWKIEGTLSGGRWSYLSGSLAQRLTKR